jgi:hypothetical protein
VSECVCVCVCVCVRAVVAAAAVAAAEAASITHAHVKGVDKSSFVGERVGSSPLLRLLLERSLLFSQFGDHGAELRAIEAPTHTVESVGKCVLRNNDTR